MVQDNTDNLVKKVDFESDKLILYMKNDIFLAKTRFSLKIDL